jgi:hypothetical protein
MDVSSRHVSVIRMHFLQDVAANLGAIEMGFLRIDYFWCAESEDDFRFGEEDGIPATG